MSIFSQSFEVEVGVPYPLEIPKAGSYYVSSQNANVILSVSPYAGGGEAVNNGGKDFVFTVDGACTMYVMAYPLVLGVSTVNCVVNDFFVEGGSEGGSQGTTYSFLPPIQQGTNNEVSLILASDLEVNDQGALTLNLQGNQDFEDILNKVNSFTNGVEIIGQIQHTNAEVQADTSLLNAFVQEEKQRAPRGGDVVLTKELNDNPSYTWIFDSNGSWIENGISGAGIATENTLGLIKGSSTISIAIDGTASVNGVVLTSGNQQIGGNKTFTDPSQFYSRVEAFPRATITDYMIRAIGDLSPSNSSIDVIRYHKAGAVAGYRANVSNGAFTYMDIWGLTLISNMKDPTQDSHGANMRYVKSYVDSKLAVNLPSGTSPSSSDIPNGTALLVIYT